MAELEGLEATLELRTVQFERSKKLLRDKQISQSDFDAAQSALDEAAAVPVDELVAQAGRMAETAGGTETVSELSPRLHVSERHLRRLFQRHEGTSPKTFFRLVRFNHVVEQTVKATTESMTAGQGSSRFPRK